MNVHDKDYDSKLRDAEVRYRFTCMRAAQNPLNGVLFNHAYYTRLWLHACEIVLNPKAPFPRIADVKADIELLRKDLKLLEEIATLLEKLPCR